MTGIWTTHGGLFYTGNSSDVLYNQTSLPVAGNRTNFSSDINETSGTLPIITSGPYFEAVEKSAFRVTIWPLIFTCIYLVLGGIGNAVVLYIYGFKWEKREKTRIFILCLAILDFLNCLINMPVEVAILLRPLHFDQNLLCKITKGITYVINNTTSLVFVAIAVDRYLLVYKPLKRWVLRSAYAVKMCLICFVIAVAGSWPSFYFYGTMTVTVPIQNTAVIVGKTCLLEDIHLIDHTLFFIFTTVLFCLLLVVFITLTALYIAIGRKIFLVTGDTCNIKENATATKLFGASIISAITGTSPRGNNTTGTSVKSVRNLRFEQSESTTISLDPPSTATTTDTSMTGRYRTANSAKFRFNQNCRRLFTVNSGAIRHNTLIMRMVTIAFMVAFTPFLVILMLRNTKPDLYQGLNENEKIIYHIFLRSYFLNSVVNPYIYGFMNAKFRARVKRLFLSIFCSKCCKS